VAALVVNAALDPMPEKTRDVISPPYVVANPDPMFAATPIVVKIWICE
jgi:hypothetical protein